MSFKKLPNFVYTNTNCSHVILAVKRKVKELEFYDVFTVINNVIEPESHTTSVIHLGTIDDLSELGTITASINELKSSYNPAFELYASKEKILVTPDTYVIPFTISIKNIEV